MTSYLPSQTPPNVVVKAKMPIARKIILITMIVAYSISALLGIIAVLAVDVQWEVIATTAIIGTVSLVILCGQTILHIDKWKYLGIVTSIFGLAAAIIGLLLIWELIPYTYDYDYNTDTGMSLYELATQALILFSFYAGAGVFSTLLISASRGLSRFPVISSYITFGLNILSSFIVTILVISGSSSYGNSTEDLTRFLGVIIILSSLSLLITLTVSLIQKVTQKVNNPIAPTKHEENSTSDNAEVSIPEQVAVNPVAYPITEESIEMLRAHAEWQGMDINAYVFNLVTRDAKEYNDKAPTVP